MNILVIGAHPDDFEFGCGGTLISFSKKAKIYILVMSKGEVGGDASVREKEQEKVCKFLNARLYWGGRKDTNIELNKQLIDTIEAVIRGTKPDIIFSHYPKDTHQDHRNVSEATITATRYIRNVLFYETPSSIDFTPTVFVDISKVIDKKLMLLRIHKSQIYTTKIKGLSILESARSTAIFRGYQNRTKFAEGFVPLRLSLKFAL
ncbi:MAG: PIG-L family deacetylase [Endomicrobia bacterium]|nr:PIG-L family deacetylase [Endomicrobiia bacterium]MCX7940602.1 PIG-L family deacetylase [Endomicrobiia bacterium]MDW8055328.1 PIG-L deacetylase family protein [Elusimicrobiota bacterium]